MSKKYLNIDWVGPYIRTKIHQLAKGVKTIRRLRALSKRKTYIN